MSQNNKKVAGESLAVAHQKCQQLYDGGARMFTKERIRDIQEQIRAGADSYTLHRIDGSKTTQIAKKSPGKRPIVQFFTYQGLTRDSDWTRAFPYCTYCVDWRGLPSSTWGAKESCLVPGDILRHASGSAAATGTEAGTSGMDQNERQQTDWQSAYDSAAHGWNSSKSRRNLRRLMGVGILQFPEQWSKVDKIVCLALGEPAGVIQTRVFTQYAMVDSIADMLEQAFGKPVRKLTQDPAYSEVTKDGLTRRGFEVIDEPGSVGALLEIDNNSIVAAVYPPIPLKQIVAELARPLMIITNKIQCPFDFEVNDKPFLESPRTKEMWEGYQQHLPIIHESNALTWAAGQGVMIREVHPDPAEDVAG